MSESADESREDRLIRLEEQLASQPKPDISSAEELGRSEAARAARHFGFTPQPSERDTDLEMARRLVETAVWMKRQYRDAGLIVARVFCNAKGIDIDELEKEAIAARVGEER